MSDQNNHTAAAMLGTSPPRPSEGPPQKAPVKPSRRRDKPQVSCELCRQKKLKCDRVKPCATCTKRGQPESCNYIKQDVITTARAQSARPTQAQAQATPTKNVQERIRHLEEVVVTLMNSQKQAAPSTSASASERSSSSYATTPRGPFQDGGFTHSPAPPSPENQIDPGIPDASWGKFTKAKEKGQVNFVGSHHWEAILEDISELKIDLENTDTSDMVDFKPQILFGVNNHATRSQIISSLPPRPFCDRLVSRWFNVMELPSLVIHAPTFMREAGCPTNSKSWERRAKLSQYDQMWRDPDGTPLMWFGLLFSILGLACHFYVMSGDELHTMPEPFTSISEMANHYRDRTVQCLVEVNYLKPVRYTVDTLCFYYLLDIFKAKDSEFGAYMVLGMIVRVAMRLGYHRDASHYPSISLFDGEMRRRTWTMIFQFDLITSALVGLPRMIREGETDTAEPKNLLDADFHEDMTELPRPRPSTDVTPVAYAIFKTRLFRQLGLIADQINAIRPSPYQDVMRLDSELTATHATLPPYLAMRPLSLSLTDRADLILRRFALEECFQKSRCLLHRKYLIPGQSNPQYRYSRTASIDAAMKLLDVQCMMHEASQPGGQLYSERWRMSALISQDFVLAAMILCLDLDWDTRFEKTHEDEVERIWPRDTRLQKLKNSSEIWSEASRKSNKAAKAAEALRVMLKRLETGNLKIAQERLVGPADSMEEVKPASASDATPSPQLYSTLPRFDTAEGLDSSTQYFPGSSTTDLVSDMMDIDTNFDWGLWDSLFQAVPTNTMPTGLQDFGSFTF